MMALFGWICLVIMMLAVTASWFIMWLNHSGQYTIGGAENSLVSRIAINVVGIALVGVWYLVFTEVPFTVSIK